MWLLIALFACDELPFDLGDPGSPCGEAQEAMNERYDECGVDYAPGGDPDGLAGACEWSDDEASCIGACYHEAPCGALDGSDPAANDALNDCADDCAG